MLCVVKSYTNTQRDSRRAIVSGALWAGREIKYKIIRQEEGEQRRVGKGFTGAPVSYWCVFFF